MPCVLYCCRIRRIESGEPPIQGRCGAASCPSRRISSTVSSVPCCVLPPAPKVTEKYFGCNSASLARVARSFSTPSGVFGGKNSMLKFCEFIYFFNNRADNDHEITLYNNAAPTADQKPAT